MQFVDKRANYSDRFIPFRDRQCIETAGYLIKQETPVQEIYQNRDSHQKYENPALRKWQQRQYHDILSKALGLSQTKILNLPRAQTLMIKKEEKQFNSMWPVHARKKPLIESPVTILDTPNLDNLNNYYHSGIDWGSNGLLAFICNHEVYIWQPINNKEGMITNTSNRAKNCVRWNNAATKLAVGLTNSRFAIVDVFKNCIIVESSCMCNRHCDVTQLQWSIDDTLITGCSRGLLCKWNSTLHPIAYLPTCHDGKIINITLSCNERYLATSGTDAKVRIWFYNSMVGNFEIHCLSNIRGVAWHPWKESFLAVGGGVCEGTISLWNASNFQLKDYKPQIGNSFIDNLAWNCITGELVASYWNPENHNAGDFYTRGKNAIMVLSDLKTEVDLIEWHTGPILHLLWGGNGTQLGTAGVEETFCIWNFLGNSIEKNRLVKLYERRQERKISKSFFKDIPTFGQTIR